jgi:hypothetical protein
MLAKEESQRLYPHDPIVIVEINHFFGYPKSFEFADWFEKHAERISHRLMLRPYPG